jgi:hypothetical protein
VKTWIIRIACVAMFVTAAPQQASRADGIFSSGGPDAGTPEYYQVHAGSPVGSRQKCKKGLLWPPRPRPTGPHQTCAQKYHAATFWPWPYICQDRAVVNATSFAQIENGWITATTLYDFHFDAETGALNTAGIRQLQWILTHVPPEQQKLYVASSFKPNMTEARTTSVHSELATLASGRTLPVSLRAADPLTRSAITVETIDRAAIENTPPPVITYQGIAGGGGGGGGN